MSSDLLPALRPEHVAWNKGRIIGQKRVDIEDALSPSEGIDL